ncbi:hypothetical protein FPV67DRAFT_1504810 [Lyophyllum atratum]|nr:hypothetical protein FPV67DRAFT_1504810 [Lyophyllum atratum]
MRSNSQILMKVTLSWLPCHRSTACLLPGTSSTSFHGSQDHSRQTLKLDDIFLPRSVLCHSSAIATICLLWPGLHGYPTGGVETKHKKSF